MDDPSLNDIQAEIVEEFALFDDPMDKYEYIIDLGNKMSPLDEKYRKDENLVKGCQSKVWLHTSFKDGRVYFEADSNAQITKGIIALLIRVLSGQRPNAIMDTTLEFIDKINLRNHLSSQRSNGLTAMIKQMKAKAKTFRAKTLQKEA